MVKHMNQDLISKYKLAYQKILAAEKILLVGHINPDGDDLSSLCVMQVLLNRLGKEHVAYCEGVGGMEFSFLPHFEDIIFDKTDLTKNISSYQASDNFLNNFDLVIATDCGSIERTNLVAEIKGRQRSFMIEFDHHQKVSDYADLEIRQSDKSSTAELLYDFLMANQVALDRDLATCILAGILTDTGNFLFPNAGPETLSAASHMLSLGVNLNRIVAAVFHNKKMSTFKLLSRALENLYIDEDLKIATSALKAEELAELSDGLPGDAFDEIVAVLSNLADMKAVLLLREYEAGKIRGNWRSKPGGYDVSLLARNLGGGGHKHAAGFQFPGEIIKTDRGWKIKKNTEDINWQ